MPVFLALFLQAMYGAADLIIVGQFAGTGDQSGVASGSQLFNTATMLVVGLTMGVTVFVARCMGAGEKEKAARGVGTSIVLFALVAIVGTAIMVPGSEVLTRLVHAPQEAFGPTQDYIQVCGIGMVFIVFYNVLGAIFRGLGDSRTPLFTVAVACLFNIAGDLFLVAGLGMGPRAPPSPPYRPRPSACSFPLWSSGSGVCPLHSPFLMCAFSKTALCPS